MKYYKEKKLNISSGSVRIIILVLLAHLAYGYLFMEVYEKMERSGPGFHLLLIPFLVASLFLLYSLVRLQLLFNAEANNDRVNLFMSGISDRHDGHFFSKKNGFQKPAAYLIPGILYLACFSYTCFVFITWIREGIAGFGYETGKLSGALYIWALTYIPIVITLYNRYTKLSGFIGVFPKGIFFRQGIKIYYIPYSLLGRMIKIMPAKVVTHMQFEIKPAGSVQLWLEPYRHDTTKIVALIEKYAGKQGHIVSQKIKFKPLFRFNRPTTMTRSSRWR